MRPTPSTRPPSSTRTRSNRCIGTCRWTGLIWATRDAPIRSSGTVAGGRRSALGGPAGARDRWRRRPRRRCRRPPGTGTRRAARHGRRAASRSARRTTDLFGVEPAGGGAARAVRGQAHEVPAAAWSSVVVDASSTDRTRPARRRVRVRGGRRARSRGSPRRAPPRAGRSPRCGPSPPTGVAQNDTASSRTGRTRARWSSSVSDVTVKSRSSQASWMTVPIGRPPSSGPLGVEDAPAISPSARWSTNSKRRGRPRPARSGASGVPAPRAQDGGGELRGAPGGSAARSSSWSVTLVLDGSATSATRPPGVGARVGRSAAEARSRGNPRREVPHGCLG